MPYLPQLHNIPLSYAADNIVNTVPPADTNAEMPSSDLFDLTAPHNTLDIWNRCWGGGGVESGKSPRSGIRGSALILRVTPLRIDNRATVEVPPVSQSLAFNKRQNISLT